MNACIAPARLTRGYAVALLSRGLCRRRGWTPSTGHTGPTISAAAIGAVFMVTHSA